MTNVGCFIASLMNNPEIWYKGLKWSGNGNKVMNNNLNWWHEASSIPGIPVLMKNHNKSNIVECNIQERNTPEAQTFVINRQHSEHFTHYITLSDYLLSSSHSSWHIITQERNPRCRTSLFSCLLTSLPLSHHFNHFSVFYQGQEK